MPEVTVPRPPFHRGALAPHCTGGRGRGRSPPSRRHQAAPWCRLLLFRQHFALMVVTSPVFQPPMSWLNEAENILVEGASTCGDTRAALGLAEAFPGIPKFDPVAYVIYQVFSKFEAASCGI